MTETNTVRVWSKSIPSRLHLDRDEDLAWSAANGLAHAVIDGMGSARRRTPYGEVGGEHAARMIGQVLDARLQNLPANLTVPAARELLAAVVREAGERVFHDVNAAGRIPPDEIPPGKTAGDVLAAAVMTAAILCEGGRRAVISQNGDTRAYLYSNRELLLLTEDQDAVGSDLEQQVLTPDQAYTVEETIDNFDGHDLGAMDPLVRRYYAQRFLVFGQIGDALPVPAPALTVIQLRPRDLLLLTSDGIHDNLTRREIADGLELIDPAAALVDRADARSAERALPDAADLNQPYNYRAHQDDITAIVIKIDWV
ncbi:MAG TPA: protein phosphatase 2C domain-containing protein [Chloroflexia bacterium]|jgi:serine/threonine protein phosphatase PrpC|nr:protein phosphatase 2C domain-containing protein [Chloroflexia bacterium]